MVFTSFSSIVITLKSHSIAVSSIELYFLLKLSGSSISNFSASLCAFLLPAVSDNINRYILLLQPKIDSCECRMQRVFYGIGKNK